jgi:hypothetical protein
VNPALSLTIDGPPRTKKNGNRRVWRKVKGVTRQITVPSEAAVEYAQRVKAEWLQLPHGMKRHFPVSADAAVHVQALFFVDTAGEPGDLTGYQQSLADALEGAGVLEDDWSIRSWDGSRVIFGDPMPRTELTLISLGAPVRPESSSEQTPKAIPSARPHLSPSPRAR